MRPPEFFIDRCLGKRVGEALRQAGLSVHIHDDHFARNTTDYEWLEVVGGRGWFVITKDHRIRTNPLEREALLRAGVGAFILKGGNANTDQMVQVLMGLQAKMLAFAATQPRPFIATLTSESITLVHIAAKPRLRAPAGPTRTRK